MLPCLSSPSLPGPQRRDGWGTVLWRGMGWLGGGRIMHDRNPQPEAPNPYAPQSVDVCLQKQKAIVSEGARVCFGSLRSSQDLWDSLFTKPTYGTPDANDNIARSPSLGLISKIPFKRHRRNKLLNTN